MCPSALPQSSLFARPTHRKSYAGSNYSHMNSEEKEVEAPHLNGMGPTPGTSPKAVSGPPLTTGAGSKSEAAVQPILDQAAVKAQEAQKAQEGHKPAQVGKALSSVPPRKGLEPGCAGGGCLPHLHLQDTPLQTGRCQKGRLLDVENHAGRSRPSGHMPARLLLLTCLQGSNPSVNCCQVKPPVAVAPNPHCPSSHCTVSSSAGPQEPQCSSAWN